MTLVTNPIAKGLAVLTAPSRLRLFVWLSLATQILIVVTGGLVRLTGSGLGCPTWPKCTEDSLISTAEMGIHGLIEFGNRLLTFVLLIVALLTFVTVVRMREDRANLIPINCSRLDILSDDPLPVQADGDAVATLPARIEVSGQRLRLH